MTLMKILLLIGVVGCCLASPVSKSDLVSEKLQECTSPNDCGSDECCAIQPIRYSRPSCLPLRKEGELCRPESTSVNTTLSYPNGSQLEITGVEWVICPCERDLICARPFGICSKSSSSQFI